MRHRLANLTLLSALGGCSLIYNPNNIPEQRVDAAPDAEPDAEIIVDADPGMLMLSSVTPAIVTEGAGDGGSRPAVIVVEGMHMVPQGLTVAITAAAGSTETPMLTVHTAMANIDGNGRRLAVPVSLPVDPALAAGENVVLDITVTQMGPGGPISQTLPGALTLRGLDELTGVGTALPPTTEWSRVEITSGTITSTSSDAPLQIRSTSSITLAAGVTINANASGSNGGPGGGDGGAGGAPISKPGEKGCCTGGGTSGASGTWAGDDQISKLGDPNMGSGGGGAPGGTLTNGASGGGGGGTVMLTAAGDLSVATINAAGANGGSGAGGGSGGLIVLRAGGTVAATTLNVGGANPGRVRYDAGGMATVPADPYRGPMFSMAPLVTTDETPTIMVTGKPLTTFSYYASSADGAGVRGPVTQTIAGNGTASFPLAFALYPGLNELCLIVPGAELTSDTRNCIHVAHLYRPTM